MLASQSGSREKTAVYTQKRHVIFALLLLMSAVVSGCSDDITAPEAVIDAPESAALFSIISLDGSGSLDTRGSALSYSWRLAEVPPGGKYRHLDYASRPDL